MTDFSSFLPSAMWRMAKRVPITLLVAFTFAKAVQLGIGVAVARTLDKEMAGIAFYLLTLISFNQLVVALGLDNNSWYVLKRYLARDKLSAYWSYIGTALIVALPVALLISLQVLFDPDIASQQGTGLIILAVALSTMIAAFRRLARMSFLATGERVRATIHDAAIANAVMILLVLLLPVENYWQLALMIFASNLLSLPAAFLDLKRIIPLDRVREAIPRWKTSRIFILLALPGLVSQVTHLVVNQSDMLMLAPLSTPEELANYGAAKRLMHVLTGIGDLVTVIYGTKIVTAQNRPYPEQQSFYTKVLLLTTAILAPFCLMIALEPKYFLALFYGSSYGVAAPILVILVLTRLLTTPFYALMPVFVMRKQTHLLATLSLVAAAVNIALNLLLIPQYGGLGAAWASLISMTLLGIGYFWLFLKRGRAT